MTSPLTVAHVRVTSSLTVAHVRVTSPLTVAHVRVTSPLTVAHVRVTSSLTVAHVRVTSSLTVAHVRGFRAGRRGPDGSQNALTAVTTQPVAVDCLGVADPMESAGAGYCVVTTSLPMPTQPHMGAVASSPGAGQQGAGGGVVYWMPVVTVPYASSMGQVNLAWAPSQDPYGKDLPLTGTPLLAVCVCVLSLIHI